MTRATAITPATRIDVSNRSTSNPGRVKAPSAPASFQSPAPRLRSSTKGSSNANPSAAPNKESFSPVQPLNTVLNVTPTSIPGTVTQFGMRRQRKSVHPATPARTTAPASTSGFKRASEQARERATRERVSHDTEKNPFRYGSENSHLGR